VYDVGYMRMQAEQDGYMGEMITTKDLFTLKTFITT
jgi:hypothetical protein